MKVVVLNDTSKESHHGCDRVMDNLYANIRACKGYIIHVSYLNDSLESPQLIDSLDQCDVAIINGEGTIHHGNPYAEALLKVVAGSKARRKYLINATYQANPARYKQYLEHFNGVFVRDSMSKKELISIDIDVEVVPDLTFFSLPAEESNAERSGSFIGCSVDRQAAITLYDSRNKLADARPMSVFKKTHSMLKRMKEVRHSIALRDVKTPTFLLKVALARFWYTSNACDTHEEYARKIASSNFVLSGRYHTICMAMKNETPFLVTPSNTFKVESLLADAGLSGRTISVQALNNCETVEISPFSNQELQSLRAFNCAAKQKIEKMFQSIYLQ